LGPDGADHLHPSANHSRRRGRAFRGRGNALEAARGRQCECADRSADNEASVKLRTSMSKIAAVVGLAFVLASGCVHAKLPSDRTRAFAKDDYVVTRKLMPRAERGDANAQAQLGFMYEHGRGVAQDYVIAVYWYMSAAAQGHPTGQYLLGLMYDKGHGVVRSATLACMWLNLAGARAALRARAYYSRIRDAVATKLSLSQVAAAQWQASTFQHGP